MIRLPSVVRLDELDHTDQGYIRTEVGMIYLIYLIQSDQSVQEMKSFHWLINRSRHVRRVIVLTLLLGACHPLDNTALLFYK